MALFGLVLMEFGDFAMLRRMLRGIKHRAEYVPHAAEPHLLTIPGRVTHS
jgi:hypothetical protein